MFFASFAAAKATLTLSSEGLWFMPDCLTRKDLIMRISLLGRTARLLSIAIPILCSAETYRIIDLGTLGGVESIATAINASGEITGGDHNSRRLPSISLCQRIHEGSGNTRGTFKPGKELVGPARSSATRNFRRDLF